MTLDCEFKSNCPIYKPEIADACDILRHMCSYRKFRIHQEDETQTRRILEKLEPLHIPFHDYQTDSRFGDFGGIDGNNH